MLRFINQATPTQLSSATFQYISCYGLSGYGRLTDKAQEHFNTSHVTVYRGGFGNGFGGNGNFNTSHVTVYRASVLQSQTLYHDFNTSHVTVYHRLLARLNGLDAYFNTSHVTVYL